MPISNFQPIRLLDPDHCYKFEYLMANNADPDQLASSEPTDLDVHCLKHRIYPGSAGQGLSLPHLIFHMILSLSPARHCIEF